MPQILLLHGALGSDRQLQPLKERLENDFEVHVLCFEGHGERTTENPLRIQNFSKNLLEYIEEHQLEKPLIFGYSMGGYVALYTEALHPGTCGKIVTLGTKLYWNPDIAAREVRMLNPEIIEEKVPKFAAHLQRMHEPNDWKENMRATAKMMEDMGENPPLDEVDLNAVECEVLLLLGTKDNMVSPQETEHVHRQLSNSKFEMLKDVEHPIEKLNLDLLESYLH